MNPMNYILPSLQRQPEQSKENAVFDPEKLGPKQILIAWEALGRPMQKFGNARLTKSFSIIGVIVALFFVILQEYFLILVIVSMIFVTQVLAKTPPENVRYEISSYGIMIDENIYYWHQLRRFFFFDHEGNLGVAIDLHNNVTPRIFLTIRENNREQIKQILEQRIQFLSAEPETFLDRTYKQVTSKFTS